jgi:hypothetical protein
MIIHLKKVKSCSIMLLMEANCYGFLGLTAALAACNCFRKSLLMLANNFLVGTFFNASRFVFSSNGELR